MIKSLIRDSTLISVFWYYIRFKIEVVWWFKTSEIPMFLQEYRVLPVLLEKRAIMHVDRWKEMGYTLVLLGGMLWFLRTWNWLENSKTAVSCTSQNKRDGSLSTCVLSPGVVLGEMMMMINTSLFRTWQILNVLKGAEL